jgi:hypothetical protein
MSIPRLTVFTPAMGPLWLFLLALTTALQRPLSETPPFTSWAQLVLFAIAVGAVVKWVIDLWRLKKNGRPDRALLDAIHELRQEMAARTVLLTQLQSNLTATTTVVTALQAAAALLLERMSNLPTKLDLMEAAQTSRHEYRNALAATQGVILGAIEDLARKAPS